MKRLDRHPAARLGASILSHPLLWLGLGLLALPLVTSQIGLTDMAATKLAIFVMTAIGFNILFGYTGLVSFGHSMFFAVGAYATALLQIHVFTGAFFTPLILAVLLCGVVGAIVGMLILRRTGVYFSLLSLAFASMIYYAIYRSTEFTGGEDGLRGLVRPDLLGVDINDARTYYWLTALIVFGVCALLWRIVNAPLGRVFVAIRENSQRASFVGYPIVTYKLISFIISAMVVGLAGGLYAMLFYIVTPDIAHVAFSGEILAMTVLGGGGVFLGPAIGAFIYILFQDVLSSYTGSWQLWFGLLFIGFVLASPDGVVGAVKRAWRLLRKEETGAAAMAARVIPPTVWEVPALLHSERTGDGPALQVSGLTKRFGGFTAVDGVNFTIPAGRLSVIIGPNGAGKTTLFNMLSGMFPPDEGTIVQHGETMNGRPVQAFSASGLCRSFQIVNLFDDLSVEENIRLAVQARHRGRFDPLRRADRAPIVNGETAEIVRFMGLEGMEPVKTCDLSGGGKRLVEIAVTLAGKPQVLLLDEPMAGLAVGDRDRLVMLIKALSDHMTVVMIEHDIDRAFDLADHVTVMADGRILADGTPEEVRENEQVQQAYLGRGTEDIREAPHALASRGASAGAPVLSVSGINTFYGTSQILHDLEFELKQGEILGLLGRNGAGKSTTVKSVMGLAPPRSGEIVLDGKAIAGLRPQEVARLGVGYVPQGRRLFANLTVKENLLIGAMYRGGENGNAWSKERIFSYFPKIACLMDRKAGVLSGGEQQQVAIARALSGEIKILLLDEPFEGLAPTVVDEVFDALDRLRELVPIIIVEHDLDRVLALSDRVIVLDRGVLSHQGPAAALLTDRNYRKEVLWL